VDSKIAYKLNFLTRHLVKFDYMSSAYDGISIFSRHSIARHYICPRAWYVCPTILLPGITFTWDYICHIVYTKIKKKPKSNEYFIMDNIVLCEKVRKIKRTIINNDRISTIINDRENRSNLSFIRGIAHKVIKL